MAEAFSRFGFFLGLLLLFSILESIYPRRGRVYPRKFRWPNNMAILAAGSLVSRVVPALLPLSARRYGWGGYSNYGYMGRGRRVTTDGRGWERNRLFF